MRNIFRYLFVFFSLFTTVNSLHGQWVHTNTPLPSDYAQCCFAVSGTNLFMGTWGGGVFLSADNGTSWTAVNIGLTCLYVDALAVNGANLFAGTYGGGVFLSTNNGLSWNGVDASSKALQNASQGAVLVKALAVSGTNVFASTSSGVFHSSNDGTSWTAASATGDNGPLAVIGTSLLAGTIGGGVFLSTNDGSNWNVANSGLTYPYVNAFAVNGTNLFAGTYGDGVFLSTNNGKSWSQANGGLMNLRYPYQNADLVNALAISDTNLFAGTGAGVFLSTNNGLNWNTVGLTNSYVVALAVSGKYLLAGIHGGGVWVRPLSEMITQGEDISNKLPAQFRLEQNYPNPFNPATTIPFSLPARSFVSLKVYDVIGREVATIVSDELPPGNYSRQWSAATLPSGLYFYRLQAGSFTETKKFVLLK